MENRTLSVASLVVAAASLAVSAATLVMVSRQSAMIAQPREMVIRPQESWLPKDAPILDAAREELRRYGWDVDEAQPYANPKRK